MFIIGFQSWNEIDIMCSADRWRKFDSKINFSYFPRNLHETNEPWLAFFRISTPELALTHSVRSMNQSPFLNFPSHLDLSAQYFCDSINANKLVSNHLDKCSLTLNKILIIIVFVRYVF